MTRRALFAFGAGILLSTSCNPLGSQSEVGAGDGILGLHPTFSPADGATTPVNPIPVTVTWSAGVTGFSLSDMTITNGTASALSGGSTVYTFTLTPTAEGPITILVPAGVVEDEANNPNIETTSTLSYDLTGPAVTVNRATSQAAATGTLPIHFTVVFNEAISASSFTTGDITQNGTATGITWTITDSGDHKTFTLAATAISGVVGTVKPSIVAGAISDTAGNASTVSTSTDNTAYYFPQYTNLKIWLKADSLSQANGSAVNTWPDSSSAANNATEATNPPTFLTPAQNSLPAVKFNGVKLLRSAAATGITGNPNMTFFLVTRLNAVAVSYPAFIQLGETDADGANARFGLFTTVANVFSGFYNGGVRSTSTTGGSFGLYVWIRDSASGTATAQTGSTQFWNGNAAATTTALSNVAVNLVDGAYRIGRTSAGATIDADIAELMVFTGTAMNASERGAMEGYLRFKYNLY